MSKNKFLTDYEKGIIDQGIADGKTQREIAIIINRSQRLFQIIIEIGKCMGRPSKAEDLVQTMKGHCEL